MRRVSTPFPAASRHRRRPFRGVVSARVARWCSTAAWKSNHRCRWSAIVSPRAVRRGFLHWATVMVDRAQPIVEVRDLCKTFAVKHSGGVATLHALSGVNFDIMRGETLGLVGESGSGKTTAGRILVGLIPATSGAVSLFGHSITGPDGRAQLASVRRRLQLVFQDPFASLNPRMRIGNAIAEPLDIAGSYSRKDRNDRVAELLDLVGLPKNSIERYPHEFSGGQRQRIGIARALALSPDFIVCDEPVSALDVSIQSQILNLLDDLQRERKIAYLFIAHNLAVVEHFSDEVAVMYLGRIVEKATSKELYANPKPPYTMALLSAVPEPDPRPRRQRIVLRGEVPSPSNPPTGCPFHPRCQLA